MPPPGIEPATPCFLACPSKPLGHRERYRQVVRTFTILFDQTILQELCIVCKAYIENKKIIYLALANTNIQYKQINYDADNIDKNK